MTRFAQNGAFVVKRLLLALLTLLMITFVVFVVIQLPPGDFVDTLVTNLTLEGATVTETDIMQLRSDYGLDRPFFIQYLSWLGGIVNGR